MQDACRFLVGLLIVPIDYILRRLFGIREFTRDPRCCLRVSIGKAKETLTLSDGTRIQAGEKVGEIHLWNERIPPVPPSGPNLAWGLSFQKRLFVSLRLLAQYAAESYEFGSIRAYRARLGIKEDSGLDVVARLSGRFGFEVAPMEQCFGNAEGHKRQRGRDALFNNGSLERLMGTTVGSLIIKISRTIRVLVWALDNLYSCGLMLVYNPHSLRGKSFWTFQRPEMWISAASIKKRYGGPLPVAS